MKPQKKLATFAIDTDALDPNDVVPDVLPADKCAAGYVTTMREIGMLQLTTDHVLDVLESYATHAEDSMLPTVAATFRARALPLRSSFVNNTLSEILTALGSSEPGAAARARTLLDAAKAYVAREYALVTHLAEVFNLDPSYTSGEEEEEEEEGEGDEEETLDD